LLPPDHGRREVEEGVDELRLVAEPLGELGPVDIDSARERSHDLGHRCGRYVPDSILALRHGTSVSGVPWLRLGRPAPQSAGIAAPASLVPQPAAAEPDTAAEPGTEAVSRTTGSSQVVFATCR